MPRPQFTLRALLVAMLVAGAFFGGMACQRKLMDIELVKRAQALDRRGDELDEVQRNLVAAHRKLVEKKEQLKRAELQRTRTAQGASE